MVLSRSYYDVCVTFPIQEIQLDDNKNMHVILRIIGGTDGFRTVLGDEKC